MRKPDPRAFQAALAAMGAVPDRVLFLDDVPENVDAARSLGLHAALHTDDASTLATIRAATAAG